MLHRKQYSAAIRILCVAILLTILSPCSLNCDNAASKNVTIVLESKYTDNPSTIFTQNTLGKYNHNTSMKVDSTDYTESYLTYNISSGSPYQFYVITAWIKAEDFHLQNSTGYGISIMVNDLSDHNSRYVYSKMLRENTQKIFENDEGWVQLCRVVKLDSLGNLTFNIRTGWAKNKSKGTVLIDQVKATPIKENSNYLLYTSTDGTIRMVFKKMDVERSGINSQKINDWLDVYSNLRKSIKWLVGNLEPYEGTTDFILTENLTHYGLAGNPIYINSTDISRELGKIELDASSNNNDLLWGLVHEMGHTFDGVASNKIDMRWAFDKEFFATLKCVYSLYNSGYGLGGDSFVGEKVRFHFSRATPLSGGVYNYEGFMYRLMQIMNAFDNKGGWEALHKTFISFNQLSFDNVPQTNIDRFILFNRLLSESSGVDIEDQFTKEEWNVLVNKFMYEELNFQSLE